MTSKFVQLLLKLDQVADAMRQCATVAGHIGASNDTQPTDRSGPDSDPVKVPTTSVAEIVLHGVRKAQGSQVALMGSAHICLRYRAMSAVTTAS